MDNPLAPPEAAHHLLHLPVTPFSRAVDRFVGWTGEIASVLWTVLVMVIVIQVVARYAFGKGSIAMEELPLHLPLRGHLRSQVPSILHFLRNTHLPLSYPIFLVCGKFTFFA